MQVRCVACHEPIDVAEDTAFGEMTCLSCGSTFSLLGEETVAYGSGAAGATAPQTESLGHFELIDQLGAGTFGSVWMARDTNLDRVVAVKIPRKGQLNPAEAEKFLREARAAAQLQHPNIVGVHEVGREDDTVYIVSDYVRGMAMDAWLESQQLTQREAAELAAKIAEALHHAHEAGIVHRDLKPGNIMMGVDGEPRIMDFGLAKRDAGEVTMTVEGRILGTPAYMPPEQARGEGHQADRRSDIYSLGVTLYRMLTGELPFRGNPQMLIVQILNDEPPSPRKFDARIARDLETICLKCMEKKPEARYQTAAEVSTELRRWMAGEAIQARPIGRAEHLWRLARRNPKVAVLSVAVMLLLSITAVGSLTAAYWISLERNEAVAAQGRAEKSATTAKIAEGRAIRARTEADAALMRAQQNERAAVASLETALGAMKSIASRLDKPVLEKADIARVHRAMGEVFRQHGQHVPARERYLRAYRMAEESAQASPGIQPQWFQSVMANEVGNASLLLGHYAEAREFYEKALVLRQAVYAQLSGNPQIKEGLAVSNSNLGDVSRDMNQLEQAKHYYSEALKLHKELLDSATQRSRPRCLSKLREMYDRLGDLHFVRAKDAKTAEQYFRESLSLAEALVDEQSDDLQAKFGLATAHEKLGNALLRLGDRTAAQEQYDKALALLRPLTNQSDQQVQQVLEGQEHLAIVLARTGRHVEANQMARQMRAMRAADERNLYNVTCCFSLCVAAVAPEKSDEELTDRERAARDEYATEAIAALREAVALGLDNDAFLRIDPDLDALREDRRFQALLEELAGAKQASVPDDEPTPTR